ncbi:MAG: phosphoribosylanthranilate isomerase [Verrucomicrobiaceae bacterium]|nr:phosphoribosylanthranilate isomerase [Verrucomicrobiaceae bacterium]
MKPEFVQTQGVAVKICGITTVADALMACAAGADALGFNFWPGSKRFIKPSELTLWAGDIPDSTERVGVFVNADIEQVLSLLETGIINAAQFHGNESAEYYGRFSSDFSCIKAFTVKNENCLQEIRKFAATTVLLDAYCPGEYGGSGTSFEWSLGRRFVKDNPDRRVVLAGGLRPDNVALAVREVLPEAVDVASGVEAAPGIKDGAMVKDFVQAVHEIDIPH